MAEIVPTRTRHRHYWQAQGLIEQQLSRFQAAVERHAIDGQRGSFYRLATYYGRTLHILNSALVHPNDELAQSALHNFMALHRALTYMHRHDREAIPIAMALHRSDQGTFVRDLTMRVLAENRDPVSLEKITERVRHLDMLGKVTEKEVHHHLKELVGLAFVRRSDGHYSRTLRPYTELDLNTHSLRALAGDELYPRLAAAGFEGLTDVDDKAETFRDVFEPLTGLAEPETCRLFIEAVRTLLNTTVAEITVWHSADLIHSPYPRPYQRAAFSVFQHGGYHAQIIEAPTGSGKTMIGMLCIQDWLRSLQAGQSILVVVPTSNYQQQWTGELCYLPIGLQLTPEIIFAGTPMQLYKRVISTGERPAIVLTTYTALAQFGSPTGKGGFDAASIEMFLQGAKIKYVLLDEVHKVVEDIHSVSTQVTRLLLDWVRDGSLHGKIGFSGTAEAYRRRFEELGLSLDYRIPLEELIAAGFVAPFAEFGLPFAYSTRERRIRELLDAYKDRLRDYFILLGPGQLRRLFADIPAAERRRLGHEVLGMYRGRKDWQAALDKRFAQWEASPADNLNITEARLVTILQMARGWSDADLVAHTGADAEQFKALQEALEAIRQELLTLIYLPKTLDRLRADDFTQTLDAGTLRGLPETTPLSRRTDAAKDLLATTITGLYDGLSEWYMRMGEGRVETIKAIIEAERNVRSVSGKIVFDTGRRIRWKEGVATPGYQGVGGLFAQMLGDPRFTVMAALSSEMYLSYDEADPLTERIAAYIEAKLMHGNSSEAIFGLVTQGLNLSDETRYELHSHFERLISHYMPTLNDIHAARPGDFNRHILKPMRRQVKWLKLPEEVEQRLLARLDRRNINLITLERTFFDYALLARAFRQARVGELEQVSGARQKFFVVPMPGNSHRKQLMYDLTARIVDADELPINFIIVSNWARTGWNVIKPNLLIDATATRNVTAWQQLIGRAIRARRTWSNDCYRLLTLLTGHHLPLEDDDIDVMDHATDADGTLDESLQALLLEIAPPDLQAVVADGLPPGLSDEDRHRLAMALAQKRNKVTHIYELVKAYGSDIQLEYNRTDKVWRRREAVAAKHAQDISVNPFTGQKGFGDEFTPFIYAEDPRTDPPETLQARLEELLPGCDETIIEGWLGE
jgi:superfamily II DNA or RNA helicase